MNFQIHFDIPFYIFLLFAVLSAGLAHLMYRKVEGISNSRQIFLTALRVLSFFLLFLAITNLVTDFIRFYSKKRDVLVLADDSRSMSLSDGSTQRARVIKNILQSEAYENLSKDFDIIPVVFGNTVLKMSGFDSLKFDQPATNIESALVEASNLSQSETGQIAFAILLTDGDYNVGGDPIDIARSLSFPVYSVGIGDSIQPKDVVVKQVIAAPSIYAGKKSTVRAVISSFGFGGKTVTARLTEDGKEVGSKDVILPDEGNVEVSYDYTPNVVGTHVLTVYVPPRKGEFNQRNNSASITAEVMKGKFSVLLVAGEPAADVAFLRRNIGSSDDFDLKVVVQKDGDSFYQPQEFNDKNIANGGGVGEILSQKYDVVLLYDFPDSQSAGTLRRISDILQSTGVPYAYFAGRDFSATEVSRLPRLPFVMESSSRPVSGSAEGNGEFQVGISPVNSSAVSVNLQSLFALLNANSSLLPPLYYRVIECKPAIAATPLALPVLNGVRLNSPVFYVSQTSRSAAFLVYGLWRMQLMSSLSGLRTDFLQDFLATLMRTLIGGGKQKLLTVNADKKVYDPSEAVDFNALFVDQTGLPVNDATVEVNIRNEATRQPSADVQLNATGDGGYAGIVTGLGEGKYSFEAQAKSPASSFGADSGTIVVEPLNTEFVQTSMNAQLLRQLSSVTNGEFMTPAEFIDGRLQLNPEWKQPVRLTDVKRFEILSSLPLLAFVFTLLSIEWIMRKIWGLP